MPWTTEQVIGAREALARLLQTLGLADYLFAIEPDDRGYRVRVECRCRDGSHVTSFGIEADALEQSMRTRAARRRLLAFLADRLGDCIRSPRSEAGAAQDDPEGEGDDADAVTLGALSEYSATAGGQQPSHPEFLSPHPPEAHPMGHFDTPDPIRRELYWYALEQATQDPRPREADLSSAEEAAIHVIDGEDESADEA